MSILFPLLESQYKEVRERDIRVSTLLTDYSCLGEGGDGEQAKRLEWHRSLLHYSWRVTGEYDNEKRYIWDKLCVDMCTKAMPCLVTLQGHRPANLAEYSEESISKVVLGSGGLEKKFVCISVSQSVISEPSGRLGSHVTGQQAVNRLPRSTPNH